MCQWHPVAHHLLTSLYWEPIFQHMTPYRKSYPNHCYQHCSKTQNYAKNYSYSENCLSFYFFSFLILHSLLLLLIITMTQSHKFLLFAFFFFCTNSRCIYIFLFFPACLQIKETSIDILLHFSFFTLQCILESISLQFIQLFISICHCLVFCGADVPWFIQPHFYLWSFIGCFTCVISTNGDIRFLVLSHSIYSSNCFMDIRICDMCCYSFLPVCQLSSDSALS